MIRHIVFFSLKTGTDRDAAIARLSDLGAIPGSTVFEVRPCLKADLFANEIDLVVYGEFPDLEALRAYKQHPTYDAVTRDVRPTRELRFAADIEG